MNQGQLRQLTDRLDKLVERAEPTMKDEMYIALRSYLEEHSQLLRQILEKLDGGATNKGPVQAAPPAPKVPAEAIGPVTVETVETVNKDATDARFAAQTSTAKRK